MDKLEREGDEMFRVFTENLEKARVRLGKCKYIRLVTPEVCEYRRVFDFDRSKILLSTVNSSLNGRSAPSDLEGRVSSGNGDGGRELCACTGCGW